MKRTVSLHYVVCLRIVCRFLCLTYKEYLCSSHNNCTCISLTIVYVDMEFLDVLTEGIDRVLMVRGGGREVVTIYS